MKNNLIKAERLFVALCLILLTGCGDAGGPQPNPRDRTVFVVLGPVKFGSERSRLEAVGTSRAIQSVTITPVTSGQVVVVNFEPGQRVERGDILVELDSRNEQLVLELAKIRMDDAERLFDRYERSENTGAVLPITVDSARTALATARVEVDRARIALEDRLIAAPFSGHVGISEVEPGDRVSAGTIITTLDNRDALLVSFEVPELMVSQLIAGEQISINTWSSREPVAYGQVVDVASRINPQTRTFGVRARVENQADTLRPGMSFRVTLDVQGEHYPEVPEMALQWGVDGAFVWSVFENQAYRIPATIIQRRQGHVLIEADVVDGQMVVVEGVQRLHEGTTVRYDTIHGEGKHSGITTKAVGEG